MARSPVKGACDQGQEPPLNPTDRDQGQEPPLKSDGRQLPETDYQDPPPPPPPPPPENPPPPNPLPPEDPGVLVNVPLAIVENESIPEAIPPKFP